MEFMYILAIIVGSMAVFICLLSLLVGLWVYDLNQRVKSLERK